MSLYETLELTGIIIGTIIALIGAYCIYFKRNHYWVGKPIPSDSPVPIFGTTFGIITGKKLYETDQDLYRKYGRVVGTYNGYKPVIYIAEPELVKQVLVKDFTSFSSRIELKTGDPLVDNMVNVVAGDEQWRNLRNTMTPAFSSGKLKKMISLVCDCAKLSVENFDKYSKNGEPVDCKKLYGNYTLDVIANVAFGTKLDSHNDPENEFVQHAKKVFSSEINVRLVIALLCPKLGRMLGITFFPTDTIEFFKNITLAIVEQRKNSKEEHHDFLSLMLESLETNSDESKVSQTNGKDKDTNEEINSVGDIKRKPLTKNEFLAQTIIFFLAGYDTTATTLTAVTYYFATNPETQKKALEEVDRIWKDRTEIDIEAVSEAKYIGAAIDEALRLTPPAVRLERTCVKECKLGDTGVTIPKGMVVEIPAYSMHRDAVFFPEPEEFKPERFLGESKTVIANSYTYLPFGAGPRNCIAMRLALMEVKICLLYVLRKFEFTPTEKTKIPMEFLNAGLLQPKDIILHVNKRHVS